MKIGLALGGGGARGIAHIGVLKVLEEEGIKVSVICGTSIGSIIAVKYANHPSWEKLWQDINYAIREKYLKELSSMFKEKVKKNPLEQLFEFIKIGKTYARLFTSTSIIGEKEYIEGLKVILKDEYNKNIEDLLLKTAVISLDIITGREVVITRGNILSSVAASSAIPGIFPPIQLRGMLLVDGGWVDVIPSSICYMLGADFVIGVNVSKDLESSEPIKNSMSIILRSDEIARFYLCEMRRDEMDVLIEPDVGDYYWNDFDKANEIFERGVMATKNLLRHIKTKMLFKKLNPLNKRKKNSIEKIKKIKPVVV